MLVFSLIQRIWPDFFPSAFSERRQQLIDTYERLANSASAPSRTAAARAEASEPRLPAGADADVGAEVARAVDALQAASGVAPSAEAPKANGAREGGPPRTPE